MELAYGDWRDGPDGPDEQLEREDELYCAMGHPIWFHESEPEEGYCDGYCENPEQPSVPVWKSSLTIITRCACGAIDTLCDCDEAPF